MGMGCTQVIYEVVAEADVIVVAKEGRHTPRELSRMFCNYSNAVRGRLGYT